MILEKVYDELMAQIEDLKKAVAGGSGGGSKDYDKLDNRPKVNNITLSGNKKSSDLKIAYSMTEAEYAAATKNAESIYCLQENAGTITDSAYVNLEVADWVDVSGVYKQTKPFVFEVSPAAGWTVEDVSIETGIATVDSYKVTKDPFGLSITYAAETLPEYGITATVTVTLTQPAGSTRIMKNGIQFGGYRYDVLFTSTGTESSYELSHPYTDYDIIVCIGKYSGTTPTDSRICRLIPSDVLAAGTSSTNWEISTEADYLWFSVTDATHFARGPVDDIKMYQIAGIKF